MDWGCRGIPDLLFCCSTALFRPKAVSFLSCSTAAGAGMAASIQELLEYQLVSVCCQGQGPLYWFKSLKTFNSNSQPALGQGLDCKIN